MFCFYITSRYFSCTGGGIGKNMSNLSFPQKGFLDNSNIRGTPCILNFVHLITFTRKSLLVCLGCYNKNTIHCVAYKQQKFISYGSGGWKFEIRAPAWSGSGASSLPGCKWMTSPCSLTWKRTEKGSGFSRDSYGAPATS